MAAWINNFWTCVTHCLVLSCNENLTAAAASSTEIQKSDSAKRCSRSAVVAGPYVRKARTKVDAQAIVSAQVRRSIFIEAVTCSGG